MSLHRGATREIHPSLTVDFDHHNHDLVADGNLVLDRVDAIVGELADSNQPLFAG